MKREKLYKRDSVPHEYVPSTGTGNPKGNGIAIFFFLLGANIFQTIIERNGTLEIMPSSKLVPIGDSDEDRAMVRSIAFLQVSFLLRGFFFFF